MSDPKKVVCYDIEYESINAFAKHFSNGDDKKAARIKGRMQRGYRPENAVEMEGMPPEDRLSINHRGGGRRGECWLTSKT